MVLILSRRGYDVLLPMSSIPSQFCASTEKAPTELCYVVSPVFKHPTALFGDTGRISREAKISNLPHDPNDLEVRG